MTSSEYFSSLAAASLNSASQVSLNWNFAIADADPWLTAGATTAPGAVEIERAAVILAAELAGARVDRDLFRGALPPGACEGAFLRLAASLPPRERRIREYLFALEGRSTDRDALTALCETLALRLPLPSPVRVTANLLAAPVSFGSFASHGNVVYGKSEENGKLKYSCKAEFKASVIL